MSRKVPSSRLTVEHAARQELSEQLSLVLRRLRKAAKAETDDVEAVHRLRVATRRARAAMEFYQPVLPPKRVGWFLKTLRKLRKAADDARNLDVFLQRMNDAQVELPAEVHALLTRQRKLAHAPVDSLNRKLTHKNRWQKKQRNLLDSISGRETDAAGHSLKKFAPTALAPLITEFSAALSMKDRSPAQLHRLRIAGKKLRYAVEIVQPSLSKRWGKLILANLEKLQATLGDLNDQATAAELMNALAQETKRKSLRRWLKAQQKREQVAFSEARAKFLRTWTAKERRKWYDLFEQVQRSSPQTTRGDATGKA